MIRRVLVTGLTVTALSFAVLGWLGYGFPIYHEYAIGARHHFYVHFADGLARFYCVGYDDPTFIETSYDYGRVSVRRVGDGSIRGRYIHALPGRISPYAFLWPDPNLPVRRGGVTQPIRLYGVRTRIWPPLILLVVYPVWAISRDRFRKRRRARWVRNGQCFDCGYDLTGNLSGVCPECGYDLTGNVSGFCPECDSNKPGALR